MTRGTLSLSPPAPARPRRSPPPEVEAWCEVDGYHVHSRHWVDADVAGELPLVLVHGFGVGSRMVRPVATELARRYPVHAPDLPGFGDSGDPAAVLDPERLADATANWMQRLGLVGAVVVGVSFGCQVAAEVARRHPSRCSRLVLASPTVQDDLRRWSSQLVRWQREQATQSMRMRVLQWLDLPKAGPARLVRTWAMAMQHRIEDTVAEIQVPVLVCWASRDPLVSRDWAGALARRAPRAQLITLPGAVHALSHDNPLELARVITYALDTDHRR